MSRPDVCRFGRVTVGEMTDHTAASTGEFAARLDRFDRGVPNPPEVVRDRVALAIAEADRENHGVEWARLDPWEQAVYRRLADAALAAIGDQQDPAVQRVLALCNREEQLEENSTARMFDGSPFPVAIVTRRIRAAVAGSDV